MDSKSMQPGATPGPSAILAICIIAFSPTLSVMLKKLSSEYLLYACGNFFACLDLERKI